MKVAVLGAGPAGLLAAQALVEWGEDVEILAMDTRQSFVGAQYIHIPIDGITRRDPDFEVTYVKWGTPDIYAKKAYGDEGESSSWDRWEAGARPAWDMKAVYDSLYQNHHWRIKMAQIDGAALPQVELMYKYVVCTIPRKALCVNPAHTFEMVTHWVVELPQSEVKDNHIIYNGDPRVQWHRASRIGGTTSYEFGRQVGQSTRAVKPRRHTCDCHPDVHYSGRYGAWKPNALATDAYLEMHELMGRSAL